jgi:hypothetical protein
LNERIKTALCRQRRGEHRRQRGNGPVYEPGESGLYDLQNEQAPVRLIFPVFDVGLKLGSFEFFGAIFVRAFLLRQVVEQLANTGVLRSCGRLLVEAPALNFHGAGLIADRVEPQWLHQPDRIAMHKAPHVLAANQWNVLAELLAE